MIPPIYQIDSSWSAGGDGAQVDANGVLWMVNPQGTTGIFDGPDNRLNHTAFNEYPGAQRSRNQANTLPITIAGKAQGPNAAAIAAARRNLVGLLADGNQHTLTITDIDGAVLTVTVEQNGKAQVTPQSQGLDFDWQLGMIAADPRKYLPSVVSSTGLPSSSGGLSWPLDWSTGGGLNWGVFGGNGLLQLTNTGTTDSWPIFTITAPTDGSTLVNPSIVDQNNGATLMFVDTLVLGDVVIINTAPYNRTTTKNGAPYRRNLQIAQYFSVPGESTMTVQFQGSSLSTTAKLTATLAQAVYA